MQTIENQKLSENLGCKGQDVSNDSHDDAKLGNMYVA